MMSPGGMHRKTFFKRTFSKLEKGSVRGSILSLCSAAVGGGVLSLPFVFVLSGWVIAVFLIVIGALAGVWSNLMIAEVAVKHRLPNFDKIAGKAGGKCLQHLLFASIMGFLVGACISY